MNRIYLWALGLMLLCLTACNQAKEDTVLLWLGSYCNTSEEGIRVYRFNQQTGDYTYLTGYTGLANPSFVWVARDGRHFYAVGEEDDPESSSANAFVFDEEKAEIVRLSSQSNHAGASSVPMSTRSSPPVTAVDVSRNFLFATMALWVKTSS